MQSNAIRLAVGCVALAVLCGCSRSTEGSTETATPPATATATTMPEAAGTAEAPSSAEDHHRLPEYGVVETSKQPLTAGAVTCEPADPPANTAEARGSGPGAPIVTIGVPDGFAAGAPGQGDVALNLTGPDGMTAAVRIAPTTLDPAAAFRQYSDDRTAGHEINSVSVLPGELCGYSGQELMGMLADQPGHGVDYADRVVHVWTNERDYLVAVQVQAPNGTPGLDAAKSVLLADFGIRMP